MDQWFGARQGARAEHARVPVRDQEGREVRVASSAARRQRDRGQDRGELLDRRPGRRARVPDDDDLTATGERRQHELDRQVLHGVEDHEVDRARRGEQVRHERG